MKHVKQIITKLIECITIVVVVAIATPVGWIGLLVLGVLFGVIK